MQGEYNEKVAYKFTPCKAPESCADYEDYDPCGSSDDITEKDLAVLLNEEKLKLQAEKENAGLQGLTEAAKGNVFSKVTEVGKGNILSEVTKAANGAQNEITDKRAVDKDQTKTEDKWTNEEEDAAGRKRVCKKFIKNPFFSNRLKFSSDLPPPPPSPPPQFLPPVEETTSKDRINCLKRRKKCRKTDDGRTGRKGGREVDKEGESDEGRSDREEDEGSAWDQEGADKEGDGAASEGRSQAGMEDAYDLAEENKGGRSDSADEKKKRKKCIKPSERPPCRKKESDVSISLQPRKIPAAQRDLPPTSPKDVSQMKRYMHIPCKKICKKKTNIK